MSPRIHLGLAALPALLGAGYLGLVKLGHALFAGGAVGARAMIGIELLYMLLVLAALCAAVVVAAKALRRRDWTVALVSAAAILACLWLVGAGFDAGAALVWAT